MAEPSFRDFAGAIMEGDLARGGALLEQLLGVDAETGLRSARFFQEQMQTGPEFMMKAMGMRTVVTGGTPAELAALLGDCFDLRGDAATSAAGAVIARFRPPA
jgi:hypothetical protein